MSGLPPFPDHGDLEVRGGKNICDFCCPPAPAVWLYPCNDFRLHTLNMESVFQRSEWSRGAWGACEPCAELIEAEEGIGLARRCPTLYEAGLQLPNIVSFFALRTGPRTRFDPVEAAVVYDQPDVRPEP